MRVGVAKNLAAVLSIMAVSAILMATGPATAQQITAGARKTFTKLENEYGVKVLKVRPVEVNGRKAIEALVMNPPGNFNEALQVTRIFVDAATGEMIQRVGHGAAGYTRSNEAPGATGLGGDGRAARRRSIGN